MVKALNQLLLYQQFCNSTGRNSQIKQISQDSQNSAITPGDVSNYKQLGIM